MRNRETRTIKRSWAGLKNLRMAELLSARGTGRALSVLVEGESIGGGLYKLRRFVEGCDYCDPETEQWIWSIGRNRVTGEIVASTGAGLYGDDESWECLFLR